MALIALAETKEWIGVTTTDDDALLTALITRVVAFLEVQTGRHFDASASHTEYLDGNGSDELYINEPADTITSVHYRSYPGDSWTEITAGDADGFEQQGRKLLRKGMHRWARGYEYRVIYDFGYATGPEDVRQLALDLVKLKYGEAKIDAQAGAFDSYQIGDTSWRRGDSGGGTMSDSALMSVPFVAETIAHWRGIRRGVA